MKKKILFVGDGGCNTGFARVCQEVVTRFAKTGVYDCAFLMWVARPNVHEVNKWQKIGVQVAYCNSGDPGDQFGQRTLPQIIQRFQPDVVWTLGDPWMVDHVRSCPGYGEKFKWISYVPIDRDELNKEWIPSLKAPDVLVLYSEFGQKVVERHLPRVKTELILHGVDSDTFRPVDKSEAKRKAGIHPETFVIGFVGRNQIRKRIPRLLRAYSFWNCLNYNTNAEVEVDNNGIHEKWDAKDYARIQCHMRPEKWKDHFKQDPAKMNSALYLHSTEGYTDNNDGLWVGWHLSEYADRYRLNDNNYGAPSRVFVPSKESVSSLNGLTDEGLNDVYNMIDIHVLPSCREGFGLPILEAMACGVPSIVTNYSSMPELVAGGRGLTVDVAEFDDEPFYDAPSALVSINGLVDSINQYQKMLISGEARVMAQACRNFAVENDWKSVFKKFNRIVRELIA